MAAVEQILTTAAARSTPPVPRLNDRFSADRAVWVCACVTDFGADAPTWLIVDTDDGGIAWCRVPDGLAVSTFVSAPLVTGDHLHPEQVLHWLEGREDRYWPGARTADSEVVERLGRKIRSLQAD